MGARVSYAPGAVRMFAALAWPGGELTTAPAVKNSEASLVSLGFSAAQEFLIYMCTLWKRAKKVWSSGELRHTRQVSFITHEMLIMPTIALAETEKDYYVVACAIPVDAPGVLHIFGRQTSDSRKFDEMDQGNACFGAVGREALPVLEDVFVPYTINGKKVELAVKKMIHGQESGCFFIDEGIFKAAAE